MKTWLAVLVLAAALVTGCYEAAVPLDQPSVRESTSALTDTQARVLGCESPATDWSASSGSIGASSVVTQGSAALAITTSGWTRIDSISMSTVSDVGNTFTFDVLVPSAASWGEVRVVLRAPSVGLYWVELGQQPLASLPVGSYAPVTMEIPAAVVTALSGSYTDLQVSLIINGPASGAPYLIDNIVMSDSDAQSPPAEEETFSVMVPSAASLDETFMSATSQLTIFSQSWAEKPERPAPVIASFGTLPTYLQAEAQAYARIYSVPDVTLDVKTLVSGEIVTEGNVLMQGSDTPDRPIVSDISTFTPVLGTPIEWTVAWPEEGGEDVVLWAVPESDAPRQTSLSPGRYGDLNLHARNHLYLSSGEYYFDTFNTEPESVIYLDKSAGPIYIYVGQDLSQWSGAVLKGKLVENGGKPAQMLMGFLGSNDVFVQGRFIGTLVAPEARIKLERLDPSDEHTGAFFADRIEVAAGEHAVIHVPFDWDFICPLGDTDGDNVYDCTDICYRDPLKVFPGICGCGNPETDRDGDGTPDCIDECPDDPTADHAGVCGCPDAPAPAGTPCDDGVCREASVCDGAGSCVLADGGACEMPGNNCSYSYNRATSRWYWFCDDPLTWEAAAAACRDIGVALAQIDDDAERLYVTAHSGETPSWIGANERDGDGVWRWATVSSDEGDRFWVGDAAGAPFFARYAAWGSGHPSTGDGCGLIAEGGLWQSASCSTTAGYVCEVPGKRLQDTVPPTKGACEVLGFECDEMGDFSKCDDEADVFPTLDEDEMMAVMTECETVCADPNSTEDQCQAACAPLNPPSASDTCDEPWGEQSLASCMLESVPSPVVACDGDPSVCTGGTVCGRYRPEDCTTFPCRHLSEPPSELVSGMVCGFPVPGCPVNGDPEFSPDFCDEETICELSYPEQTVTDFDNGPGVDLSHDPFDPETIYPEPQVPPNDPTYPDESDPCGGACNQGQNHPWCKLGIAEGDALNDRDAQERNKRGSSGGGLVSFDFDPRFRIDHDMEVGPFGLPMPTVEAEAGFKAEAAMGSFAGNIALQLLEARTFLTGHRCEVNADAVLKVFGKDFVPLVREVAGGAYPLPLQIPEPDPDTGEVSPVCEAAFKSFEDAANRAKKAFRDATDLLRQYNEAVADDTTDPATWTNNLSEAVCEAIEEIRPRGFPPVDDCSSESPEETINRFIEYYRRSVVGFGGMDGATNPDGTVGLRGLTEAAAHLADNALVLTGGDGRIPLYSYQKTEEITVFQSTFFVGPIPVNLELLATLDFGADVDLTLMLDSGAVVDSMLRGNQPDPALPIAYVESSGEPRAGAGIALFAGVGFGVPGFKAKIGIQGDISLGTIHVPAFAGAGVGLGSEIDGRPIPEDVLPFSTGRFLVPPKRTVVDLRYMAGLRANLRDILSGGVSAKLRLKIAFFKKTWSKRILSFNGICPTKDENKSGFPPFCDIDLISIEGASDPTSGAFPWGVVRPAMPFPELAFLAPSAAETGDALFDGTRVEDLFFDTLCTCIDPTDPEHEDRQCFRKEDCCAPYDALCFANPENGRNECSGCRQSAESCNEDDECCSGVCFDNPETGARECSGCRSLDTSCNDDGDCCSGNCFPKEGFPTKVCTPCRGTEETCWDNNNCCPDTGDVCRWDPTQLQGFCRPCQPDQLFCSDDNECCPGSSCVFSQCRPLGQCTHLCEDDNDCETNLSCVYNNNAYRCYDQHVCEPY